MLKYYSTSEIAQTLSISEFTVRKYCRENRVVGAVKFGKSWRIPETSVDYFFCPPENYKPKVHTTKRRTVRNGTEKRFTIDLIK